MRMASRLVEIGGIKLSEHTFAQSAAVATSEHSNVDNTHHLKIFHSNIDKSTNFFRLMERRTRPTW